MNRREFIALLAARRLLGRSRCAHSSRRKLRELASPDQLYLPSEVVDAFRQGLRELGYVEGMNILVEYRTADGNIQRLPELVSELIRSQRRRHRRAEHARCACSTASHHHYPHCCAGYGRSCWRRPRLQPARPGGNITGLTFLGPELVPKRLALLKDALPLASRVAALWHPGAYGERTMSEMMKETEAAARSLGVQLRLLGVQGPDELERAFSTMSGERAEAVIVFPSPMLFVERRRIVDLAAKHRLPLMAMGREFVELGGLISYGASITDLNRLAQLTWTRSSKVPSLPTCQWSNQRSSSWSSTSRLPRR